MIDTINMHSLVLLHYSISLPEGDLIETSFDNDPIEITMGHGDLTEGMELAIYGLKEGDKQTLTLTPEQCYGFRDEDNISEIPVTDFPADMAPQSGLTFSFETHEGVEIPGTVLRVKDDNVEVDFNHPLAGQELVFKVEILGINNAHAEIPSSP